MLITFLYPQPQLRQTINRLLFQFIHSAGIFFRMLQPAMSQQTGNGLNVCAVVQNIHGKGMSSAMPTDMLVYSGAFHPTPH